jgi:hypothetical protein
MMFFLAAPRKMGVCQKVSLFEAIFYFLIGVANQKIKNPRGYPL